MAELDENFDGRLVLAGLQHADVLTRHARLGGDLLLRQTGFEPEFMELRGEHGG